MTAITEKFGLPYFTGRSRRNIFVLAKIKDQFGRRKIFGIDVFTGKVVNIVDTESNKLGIHFDDKFWVPIIRYSVIQAEFECCFLPSHHKNVLNTLKIVSNYKILGNSDLFALLNKYKTCAPEFTVVYNLNDIKKDIDHCYRDMCYILIFNPATRNSSENGDSIFLCEMRNGELKRKIEYRMDVNKEVCINKKKLECLFPNVTDDEFAVNFEYNCLDEQIYLKIRKVSELVHFTCLNNLESILLNGLLPRNKIPNNAIVTDDKRMDGKVDCTCLSVTFPNYQMFYRKRCNNSQLIFIVLSISPDVLSSFSEKNVGYFSGNAASHCFQNRFDNYNKKYLEDMFAYTPCHTSQTRSNEIPMNFTTDPQAEILFRGKISSQYIQRIYVENMTVKNRVESILREIDVLIPVEINLNMFNKRVDHSKWDLWNRGNGGFTDYGMQTGF